MSPKGQPNAEEKCPKKEELGRRGSEFTGEGVVTAHWEKEKLAGCPLQSRATALGQAGTASARRPAGGWGQVCREPWDFAAGARLRSHRVCVGRSRGNGLEEQESQGSRAGTEKEGCWED